MTIQDTQGSTANLGGAANVGALPNVIGITQLLQMHTDLYTAAVHVFGQREYGYNQEQIVDNADHLMAILWPRYVANLQGIFGNFLGGLTLGQDNANVGAVPQRGAA